jgi:hypothetical protein
MGSKINLINTSGKRIEKKPRISHSNLIADGNKLFIQSNSVLESVGNRGFGGGGGYVEITYQELLDAKNNNQLSGGTFYLITDFQTCYDQPDYNYVEAPILENNYKVSEEINPIIVFATSNSTLSPDAYQPSYPKDKIKYDIGFNETEVTNSAAKGRIIERIDEWNNRTDYDHRTVLFKRYPNYSYKENDLAEGLIEVLSTGEVIGTDTQFESYTVGDIIAIPALEEVFFEIFSIDSNTSMFITGTSISTNNSIVFYLASQDGLTYKGNNISTGFTEHPTFLLNDKDIVNNYIGDVASLYDWKGYDFLLPNNVFGEDVINNKIGNGFINNTFESDVEENVIGDFFRNNTIINDEDFTDNQIWNNFANNLIICDDFNDNVIGDGFEDNVFTNGTDFVDNVISVNFSENVITADFNDNNIGNGFVDNKIYNEFLDNKIGNYFENNTLGESNNASYFENNDIGNDFKANLILGEFYGNKIGLDFKANEISGNFNDNDIGNYFFINNIGDSFRKNIILNNFENNEISDYFSYNRIGNNFYNNTIDDDFGFGGSVNRGNVIGNSFQNNNIGEYFYDNNIGDNFINNQIGDYFQFNRVETPLNEVDFTEYLGKINTVIYPPTSGTDGIYSNVIGTTSGEGTGGVFEIEVSNGSVSVVNITDSGKLYQVGDTITIHQTEFGGTDDLILTVDMLNAIPMVYDYYNKTIQRDFNGNPILVAIANGNLYTSENITEPID